MPVWTLEEVKALSEELNKWLGEYSLNNEQVERRFHFYGGIPRYLFDEHEDSLSVKVKCAISNMPDDVFVKLACGQMVEASHMVFQVNPQPGFRQVDYSFASRPIHQMAIDSLTKRSKVGAVQFLKQAYIRTTLSSLKGELFELYGHADVTSGTTFKRRKINATASEDFKLSSYQLKHFHAISEIVQDIKARNCQKCYYQPKSKTFASVDSLAISEKSHLMLFQFTSSGTHGIKASGLIALEPVVSSLKEVVDNLPAVEYNFVVNEPIWKHDYYKTPVTYSNWPKKRNSLEYCLEQYVMCHVDDV